MHQYYALYDLTIDSELPLAAPQSAPPTDNPITISYGRVSKEGLQHPLNLGSIYQSNRTDFWINIKSIARFQISRGEHITIDPVDGIDEDSIRAFLLNTCFEVLLRQRQMMIIQGYAIHIDKRCVVVTSGMGAGASLLQGLLYKRGHSFAGGNFVALNPQGNVVPGSPQIEFWPGVTKALQLDSQALKTIRPNVSQYIIPLAQQHHAQSSPLQCIYTLRMHQRPDIIFSNKPDAEKLPFLRQQAKLSVSADLWNDDPILEQNQHMLEQLPMMDIYVPASGLKLPELANAIETHVNERDHYHVES